MMDAFFLVYGEQPIGDGSKDGNESKDGDGQRQLAPSNLLLKGPPEPREGP